MQQMIPGQVSGADQPQEEVQLTELLPVKQSRIRENNIFKDADATDALKALRSFSDTCEEQEYELRVFGYSREASSRKRNGKRKIVKSSDDTGKEKDEGEKKRGRFSGKSRTREEEKVSKKKLPKSKKGDDCERDNDESLVEDVNLKHVTVNGDVLGGMNVVVEEDVDEDEDFDDEEDCNEQPSYLDLDKNRDSLNDEVYVFRREPLDSCLTPDTDREEEDERSENLDDYYDNYSTTDGNLFEQTGQEQPGGKENGSLTIVEKGNSPKRTGSSEKELRLKIDAIIEANILLERENNNVVHPNTKIPPSPDVPAPASTDSKASSDKTTVNKEREQEEQRSNGKQQQQQQPVKKEEKKKESGKSEEKDEILVKKYCCVICEARFKGSGGLRNHYKVVHAAGPVFKCDECGKEFPLKERLKLHVRTHTGFKPYKCPECDKCFARGGQLAQHRRTHSQEKPYHCVICSGTFTCAANLALHVKRHNGQKDHKCEICGRGFVRRDALKKHLECLHRDVKSFLCVICNKTFKGHLPQHMRTHARDRPHGCATCGQRFAQKSQLTVHQRTHSGQRPFRCLVCWQAFAHSTALKLHTRRHTGERPFKCVECNAGFTQLPHWKKHMKCIHGRNEPYGCRQCNSFFRIKNDLENHEKTCHPETQQDAADADGNSGLAATTTMAAAAAATTTTTTTTTTSMTTAALATSATSASVTTAASTAATTAANSSLSNSALANNSANNNLPDKLQPIKYQIMSVEKMRLLLAVLLKRISKQEKLDELGFGKRLIDQVLRDSLISAGKDPVTDNGLSELEALTKNLEIFLEWTVPKEHWNTFRRLKKSPEEILETLTAT